MNKVKMANKVNTGTLKIYIEIVHHPMREEYYRDLPLPPKNQRVCIQTIRDVKYDDVPEMVAAYKEWNDKVIKNYSMLFVFTSYPTVIF